MTRPDLHRQVIWTDAKAYRPDLYNCLNRAAGSPFAHGVKGELDRLARRPSGASLAAVTLPDSGKPSRGTASKATDLSWANAVPAPRHSGCAPSRNLRSVSAIRRVSAFAIDALMWAVFAGCFLLLASGRL